MYCIANRGTANETFATLGIICKVGRLFGEDKSCISRKSTTLLYVHESNGTTTSQLVISVLVCQYDLSTHTHTHTNPAPLHFLFLHTHTRTHWLTSCKLGAQFICYIIRHRYTSNCNTVLFRHGHISNCNTKWKDGIELQAAGHWTFVLDLCIGRVYWFNVLDLCTDSVYWTRTIHSYWVSELHTILVYSLITVCWTCIAKSW